MHIVHYLARMFSRKSSSSFIQSQRKIEGAVRHVIEALECRKYLNDGPFFVGQWLNANPTIYTQGNEGWTYTTDYGDGSPTEDNTGWDGTSDPYTDHVDLSLSHFYTQPATLTVTDHWTADWYPGQTFDDVAWSANILDAQPTATMSSEIDLSNNTISVQMLDQYNPTGADLHYSYSITGVPGLATSYEDATDSAETTFSYTPGMVVLGSIWDPSEEKSDYSTLNIRPTINFPDGGTDPTKVTIAWADVDGNQAAWRLERSTDGTNYTLLTSVSSEITNYPDTDVTPGQTYWYKLRGAGADGGDTAYSFKKKITVPLAAPTDVTASNLQDANHDIQVGWNYDDSPYVGGFTVTLSRTGSSTHTMTVESSLRSATFAGLDDGNGQWDVTVVANHASDSDYNSAPSDPVQNVYEPNSPWMTVYQEGDYPNGGNGQLPYANVNWVGDQTTETGGDDDYVGWGNQDVKLNIDNLPRHTYVSLDLEFIVNGGLENSSSLTEMVDGATSMQPTHDQYVINSFGDQADFWDTHLTQDGKDAFKHTGSSISIDMNMTNLPANYCWQIYAVRVQTYFPFVSINGAQAVDEDGLGTPRSFTLTAYRSGSSTIDQDPINVNLKLSGTATPGADYTGLDSTEVIQGGQSLLNLPITPVDDDLIEDPVETIIAQIQPSGAYALAGPATASGGVNDDDFEIIGASVAYSSGAIYGDDDNALPSPSWQDYDGNHEDDRDRSSKYGGNGTLGMPIVKRISYNQGDGVQYVFGTAGFIIHGNPLGALKIVGSGSGPGGGSSTQDATVFGPDGNGRVWILGGYNPAAALPTTITNGTLAVDWNVRKRNGQNVHYGTSKDHIYVTGSGGGDFETVLDIGTAAAAGKRPHIPGDNATVAAQKDQDVVTAVWSAFSGRHITRVDGTTLKYWGDFATNTAEGSPHYGELFTTAGLLLNADGRCGAWAPFFVENLAAQGVNSAYVQGIYPNHGGGPAPTGTVSDSDDLIVVNPTAQAQGGAVPMRNYFTDHAVVMFGDQIYDPSYGGNPFASALAWEDASLNGFRTYYWDGNQDIPVTTPDAKGVLETDWPPP